MDRLVEKSVFVTAARLGLMRLKAPPGSARETGSGKQEKLVCTPGNTIDGPDPPGWAGLGWAMVFSVGLGAGSQSGAWPWPGWGSDPKERPRLAWTRTRACFEAVDVSVGRSQTGASAGLRDFE